LHHRGNAIGLSGRHEPMNMIRHQDIGVYRRLVVCGGFFQIMQVSSIILFSVKTRLAIITPLYNMLRNSR
jgi:hypothetical protein